MDGHLRFLSSGFALSLLCLAVLFNLGVHARVDLYGLCSCFCVSMWGMTLQFLIVQLLFVCFARYVLLSVLCVMSLCQSVSTSSSRGNCG